MPEPKRPLKVFLSYASQDKPLVRELSGRLASEGWIDPWVDEKKLLPGQDWRVKIEEAVETSDIVIICLSSNSVTKEGFVQKELRYAREIAFEKPDETIFLIPLRLDDCTVPRGLRFYQWGDYFGENKEETYDALLEALKLRHEQKLKLEAEEHARREKAEKERIALEEKARKEAEEKARLEEAERAQRERDERERKAAEANERKEAEEKARRETEERARIEKAEKERKAAEIALQKKKKLEAAQKTKREKAEREATERVVQEKLKRDAAEKSKRERAERQTAQIVVLKEIISKSFAVLKSPFSKAFPFLRIVGFIGIIIVLLWGGSSAIPKFIALIPTVKTSVVASPTNTKIVFTKTPVSPTKTIRPNATPTKTRTPAPTATLGVGSTIISDRDGMKLVYVPAGEFTMGSDADDVRAGCLKFPKVITDCQRNRFTNEEPLHSVSLDAFWIDQTEVTNKMYENCINAGACKEPVNMSSGAHSIYIGVSEFDNYPVLYVDWNMANAYCSWAGRRLPTEAEWEKAARGMNANIYPWGNVFDGNKLNFCDINCGISHQDESINDGYGDVSPVGNYPSGQSVFGAYDMAGNVWEWVSTLYRPYPYDANDGRENLSSSESRVLRGGSWNSDGNVVRSAIRVFTTPDSTSWNFGFRCGKDANP